MATVFEKDWFTKANVPIDNSSTTVRTADLHYKIKQLLTGGLGASQGLWVVIGSSNAVGFGMDGIDRWVDVGSIQRATSATGPRSWIALQGPGSDPYFCTLEAGHGVGGLSLGGRLHIRLFRSRPAGGALNAAPTAPDMIGQSLDGTGGNASPFDNVLVEPFLMAAGLANDGSFFWFIRRRTSGIFTSGMIFSTLTETRDLDISPAIFWQAFPSYAAQNSDLLTNLDTSGTQSFSTNAQMLHPDGSGGAVVGGMALADTRVTTAQLGSVTTTISYDFGDGDGSTPDWHMYIATRESSGAVRRSLRGRVQDIRWAPRLPHGTVEPNTSNPRSMAIGHVWFPMSEVPDMS